MDYLGMHVQNVCMLCASYINTLQFELIIIFNLISLMREISHDLHSKY